MSSKVVHKAKRSCRVLGILDEKKQNLVLGLFFSLGRKVKTRVRVKHV